MIFRLRTGSRTSDKTALTLSYPPNAKMPLSKAVAML